MEEVTIDSFLAETAADAPLATFLYVAKGNREPIALNDAIGLRYSIKCADGKWKEVLSPLTEKHIPSLERLLREGKVDCVHFYPPKES